MALAFRRSSAIPRPQFRHDWTQISWNRERPATVRHGRHEPPPPPPVLISCLSSILSDRIQKLLNRSTEGVETSTSLSSICCVYQSWSGRVSAEEALLDNPHALLDNPHDCRGWMPLPRHRISDGSWTYLQNIIPSRTIPSLLPKHREGEGTWYGYPLPINRGWCMMTSNCGKNAK